LGLKSVFSQFCLKGPYKKGKNPNRHLKEEIENENGWGKG
jgi:hypothetical protein